MVNAQTKMKALVVSRLLLGDIPDWQTFESERETASKILNRRTARSVSSQIGRSYRDLSTETRKFIEENFVRCEYEDLARLCDEVKSGSGLSVRLDEFEQTFFPLADSVKRRFPFYAHVSISTYGLKFEFPEHHFLRDIEASLPELLGTRLNLEPFIKQSPDAKHDSGSVAALVAREKFLSRSIVSAAILHRFREKTSSREDGLPRCIKSTTTLPSAVLCSRLLRSSKYRYGYMGYRTHPILRTGAVN